MPYKFSRCISFPTADRDRAADFYEKVLGFEVVERQDRFVEFKAEQNRIFIDQSDNRGPVMELIVPDLEKAKQHLIKNGCHILTWNGKGKDCYIRDPFGFLFNIWEGPEAFKD